MSRTVLDIPPETWKTYRLREAFHKRRSEIRAELAKRRRRAYTTALKAAKLLKEKFGATEVILFGSLVRRGAFTRFSDIDLAVENIPSDLYLTAMDTVLHMNPEFKIDLIDLANCSPALRAEIEKEGKPL